VACGEGVGRGVWEGFDVIFEEGRIYIGMKGVLLHAGVHVTSQSHETISTINDDTSISSMRERPGQCFQSLPPITTSI
jgi:hypothetical protein